MLSFVYLILTALLVNCGLALWRLKDSRGSYTTAALSLWLGAYTSLVNAPIFSSLMSFEVATLGYNLSVFVGLPMLALVLLDLMLNWGWQKATWGRIFLALAAMFEVMRRADAGNNYTHFIFIVCILTLAFTLFKLFKSNLGSDESVKKITGLLSVCLALMMASLWSFHTAFALLWNGLGLLALGGYLYLSA
ncbi:MAG: hypothetical protein KC426_06940 [Oceanospirillaceae bacterium]|nr:hypothetical protein [Oceanospirillaceae bacterium]